VPVFFLHLEKEKEKRFKVIIGAQAGKIGRKARQAEKGRCGQKRK